ncbi:TIR domain-containing protein [Microbispora sp. ZYX-F-249]|uniref:TIR domain-containing protein n=1 Tax=Microbispora maris TaxID=3144104 RepID=A0ABV0AYA5_9ACTN
MTQIFIASSTEGRPYAEMIAANLMDQGVVPLLWWSQASFPIGTTLIEALMDILERVDGAIIVMTPDDRVTRRGTITYSPTQNVLLEYGLFAGKLGRANVAIAKIGNLKMPSDLDGVVYINLRAIDPSEDEIVYRSVELKPSFSTWLHELDAQSSDGARLAALAHRVAPTARPEDRLRIKARMLCERVDPKAFQRLTADSVEHLLLKHTFENEPHNDVGYRFTTPVSSYLALTRIIPGSDDERVLAAHFARNVAELIASRAIEPTVLAISKNAALGLLQSVAKQLRFPVVLIAPYGPNRKNPIEGYYEVGDRAVLLHDVALSGHHLVDCIVTLRNAGLYANHLVTLAQHYSDEAELKALMRENEIEMFASALLLPTRGRVICTNPATAVASPSVLDCVLCDVVAGRDTAPVWEILHPSEIGSEVVMESSNFVATADVAPLAPGHTLIITKRHALSMSKCSPEQLAELDAFRRRVAEHLRRAYGNPTIMFEHGLCNRARASGCGVDHAHLHVVPVTCSVTETFLQDFDVSPLRHLAELRDKVELSSEYLMLIDDEENAYFALTGAPTRQYFRRVISTRLNRELWNWNDELLLRRRDEVRELILHLHSTFGTKP